MRHAFRLCPAPRDLRFNDIGCGKGKVVITAALEGFRDVRGLDFAPELIDVAEQNLARVRDKLPAGTKVAVERADVTVAEFGPRDSVFFLYNPFAADVMRGFSEHLARSLQQHPRPDLGHLCRPGLPAGDAGAPAGARNGAKRVRRLRVRAVEQPLNRRFRARARTAWSGRQRQGTAVELRELLAVRLSR